MKHAPIIAGAALVGAAFAANATSRATLSDLEIAEVNLSDVAFGNLRAFLAVIREGESSDNYRALVGGGEFQSFRRHPADDGGKIRKEGDGWKGIRRSDDGRLTTAAGAYQITHTTYMSLGGGDFHPESQDLMAIRLLIRRDAYSAVIAGEVERAVSRLYNEWEMFKQPRWNLARVVSTYESNGGFFA
jgi:muramidase (phage lysozyme)